MQPTSPSRAQPWALIGSVTGLSLLPPLLAVYDQGLRASFRFFAADAFYYLAVAKHARRGLTPTFDGVHPTNGFHPLWQALLSLIAHTTSAADEVLIGWSFWLSVGAVSGGSVLFALALGRLTKSFWWALLGTVPGFFYWAFLSLDAHQFSSWSWMNGMESGLSCLFFGGFTYAFLGRPARQELGGLLVPTLLLTAAVFARLDDAFYLVAFATYAGVTGTSPSNRRRRLLLTVGLPAALLSIYLITNTVYAGQALPVSGTWKNDGLVALLRNLGDPFTTFFPPLRGALYGNGLSGWGHTAQKTLALLLPGGVALGWLLMRARKLGGARHLLTRTDAPSTEITVLAVGALLKSGYNFLFVGIWSQGTWYFTANLMTLHLLVAYGLSRAVPLTPGAAPRPGQGTLLHRCLQGSAFALFWLQACAFAATQTGGDRHDHYFTVWTKRAQIEQELTQVQGNAGVLEYDDGIISFALERSVMSGLGFALDREAVQAKRQGRLLSLAYERGVRALASTNYFPALSETTDSATIRSALRHETSTLNWEKLDDWDFAVIPVAGVEAVRVVAFWPRTTPRGASVDKQAAPNDLTGLVSKLRRRLGLAPRDAPPP